MCVRILNIYMVLRDFTAFIECYYLSILCETGYDYTHFADEETEA